MKVYESHSHAQRFKTIFGKDMSEFLDRLILALTGEVALDLEKLCAFVFEKDELGDNESIAEAIERIYGAAARNLIEDLI